MKAVVYTRVSTAGQANDGVSMDAQESKARAWADFNGYSKVEVFSDAGISGSSMDKRDGLSQALKAIEKGDVLIVYSLSRLARSTKDTLEISDRLAKRGADLVSLSEKIDTTNAAGKMVFRMLAVLSEFERDQVAERTKTALCHKKSKGERVGAIPYGFCLAEDGKTLQECGEEQQAIEKAKELKLSGMSLRQIANALQADGYKARNGHEFAAMQISRMLAA